MMQSAVLDFLTMRYSYTVDAVFGIVLFSLLVWVRQRILGIRWKRDVWPKLQESPLAMAVFLGLTFVGLALLVGLLAIAGATH